MSTRSVIIKALRMFDLHTDVSRFMQMRILRAKKRCYIKITAGHSAQKSGKALKVLIAASVSGVLFVSAGVSYLLVSRYHAAQSPAFITFYTGSVAIKRKGSQLALSIKTQILDGDIVKVANHSCLVIQTADEQIIRFEENTEAVVTAAGTARDRTITLHQGKVLSLIRKLSKGSGYQVRTPLAIAAVRGTMFLTQYNGQDSIVAVSDGRVKVSDLDGGNAVIVEKGSSAVDPMQTKKITLRSISAVEKLELSKLELTPLIENIDKKKPEEIESIFREKNVGETELKINSNIEDETGLTFEEMKKKYGRVDTLTLYSGQIITGVIVAREKKVKVLTAAGPVYVTAEEIRNTETKHQ